MHSWFQYCTDNSAYEKCRTLKDFIATLRKQSNTDPAVIPYRETVRLDDYNDDGEFVGKLKAPRYFGAGFEAFTEVLLDVFGHEFNLAQVQALDSTDADLEDTGYDLTAVSIKRKRYRGIKRQAETGSPVYIQVKATFNATKEFMTNDGSRIMNFFANAQGEAGRQGMYYQARYVLVTSGKGLHYKLDKNTQKAIEVLNYTKIGKLVNDNPLFWNAFRARLGLSELAFVSRKDPEAECLDAEFALENQ